MVVFNPPEDRHFVVMRDRIVRLDGISFSRGQDERVYLYQRLLAVLFGLRQISLLPPTPFLGLLAPFFCVVIDYRDFFHLYSSCLRVAHQDLVSDSKLAKRN